MPAIDVVVTLSDNTNWVFTNAASDSGSAVDDPTVNTMLMGMSNVATLMVKEEKQLDDYSTQVESNSRALDAINELSGEIQNWGDLIPPKAADLMLLNTSGLIKTTPNSVNMIFSFPGHVFRTVLLEQIQQVPPDYPSTASLVRGEFYTRRDGTFFLYDVKSYDAHLQPILGEREAKLTGNSPITDDLISTWTKSLNARKDELTSMSQTQVAYLQSESEAFDRLMKLLTAFIDAVKKTCSGLTGNIK